MLDKRYVLLIVVRTKGSLYLHDQRVSKNPKKNEKYMDGASPSNGDGYFSTQLQIPQIQNLSKHSSAFFESLRVAVAAHPKRTKIPFLAAIPAAPAMVLVGRRVDASPIAANLRELTPLPTRPTVKLVHLHIHTLLVAAEVISSAASLGLACFRILVACQPGSLLQKPASPPKRHRFLTLCRLSIFSFNTTAVIWVFKEGLLLFI